MSVAPVWFVPQEAAAQFYQELRAAGYALQQLEYAKDISMEYTIVEITTGFAKHNCNTSPPGQWRSLSLTNNLSHRMRQDH